MSLDSGTTYTEETQGVSGDCSNITHLLVSPYCSRESMSWHPGMSRAVRVCCSRSFVTCCFSYLGLSSQPMQAAVQFAHRSSLQWWDDICAWGSEEKGQANAAAGNTNAQPNVPCCPWVSREAAGFFSAAVSELWSSRSDAFLRLNYWVLLLVLFSSPAANCKTS